MYLVGINFLRKIIIQNFLGFRRKALHSDSIKAWHGSYKDLVGFSEKDKTRRKIKESYIILPFFLQEYSNLEFSFKVSFLGITQFNFRPLPSLLCQTNTPHKHMQNSMAQMRFRVLNLVDHLLIVYFIEFIGSVVICLGLIHLITKLN